MRILGLDPDRDAFVMEFVEGKTLAELLRTSPQTIRQPQVAVDMFAQLLDAFDYAHHVVIEIGARQEQGVIHRDIKPSNIIIEPDGRPKILDFGISRISTFESTLTDPKLQMGSVAYMSPEQIVNPAGVDWRSDIYALGVNLWELFAGRPPYPQVTNFEAVIQVQNSIRFEPLPLLTDLHGDSEADELAFLHRVDEVVGRATAKDPLQRYQRCRDMRDALLATLVPIQTSGSEPTPDPEVFSKHVVESVPVYTPP
ncbi:serine/threonine-protein kinase [Spirosoma telluris]|uniref:serine/threonine-protein kinase n=1 Tax=Spirosoma telluris TaxID=2183553 RepID=UPI002FC27625